DERGRSFRCRRSTHVGEVASELEQESERDQHTCECDPRVAQHLVRETREAERSGDDREKDDRALVRKPLVYEPVRGMVAPAARDRSPLEEAYDRDERRIE